MNVRLRQRRGNVLVLTVFMMMAIFALLACAIDLGYLEVVHTELQRTADSAAIAAAWELIDERALSGYGDTWLTEQNARNAAAGLSDRGHLFLDRERLLTMQPETIFIDGGGLASVRADYLKKGGYYRALDAFRERRVYVLFPYNW